MKCRAGVFVAALCWVGSGTASAELPIEGDGTLIKKVLASYDASVTKLTSKGRLIVDSTLEFRDFTGKGPGRKSQAHTHVLWEGENSRWKISEKQSGGTVRSEVVLTPKRRIYYSPDGAILQITETPVFGHPEVARVQPADVWFSFDRISPFRKFLDPEVNAELLTKYSIRKEGDRITIQRHYKDSGAYQFVVSAVHGNVVSYDTVGNEGKGFWRRGRLDWSELPGKGWYLKSCRYETAMNGSEDKIDTVFTFDVTDYDPSPTVSAEDFSLKAIPIPLRTKVEEYGPTGELDRTYRIGG